jgi:hypothetical protein
MLCNTFFELFFGRFFLGKNDVSEKQTENPREKGAIYFFAAKP